MLLEIEMKHGLGHNFYLNSDQYTNYPNEKEVILDDGVGLWVKDVVQERDRITDTAYTLIKLQMSSKSRKSDSNVLVKIQASIGKYINGFKFIDKDLNVYYS